MREESEGSASDPAAFTRELCRELGSLSIASHVTFPVGTGERNLVMRDSPLVSVIILNYKRRDALKLALESVMAQDYQNREIIVVDNNSRDDAEALVHAFDPNIIFIGLSENLGSSAGRNAGIRRARGEILVTIDNDVLLDSPFELTHIVQTFEAHPEVHVLAFQICDGTTGQLRLREWCHPRSWKEFGQSEFETHFLPEGASAFRREALDRCGLYYEPFFIGHEGGDLALRLLDRGFRILYAPRVRVRHLQSAETRTQGRPYYIYTRNYVWLAYKDYRWLDAIRFLVPKLAMMFYFSLRTGFAHYFLRGLWDGARGLKSIHRDRSPVGKSTIRYIAELEESRPNWRVRLARHREQPEI